MARAGKRPKFDSSYSLKLYAKDMELFARNTETMFSDPAIMLRALIDGFNAFCAKGRRPVPPIAVSIHADAWRRKDGVIETTPAIADRKIDANLMTVIVPELPSDDDDSPRAQPKSGRPVRG